MKKSKWTGSDRLFAVIILICMTIVAVGGSLGISAMVQYNIYKDDGTLAWEVGREMITENTADVIEQAYYNYLLNIGYDGSTPLPPIGNGTDENGKALVTSRVLERFQKGSCNCVFQLKDIAGNILWYNYMPQEVSDAAASIGDTSIKGTVSFQYAPVYGCTYYLRSNEPYRVDDNGEPVKNSEAREVNATLEISVFAQREDGSWPARDSYSTAKWWIDLAGRLSYVAFFVVALAIIAIFGILSTITANAGNTDESGTLVPGLIDKLPLDLVTVVAVGLSAVGIMCTRLTTVAGSGMVTENTVSLVVSILMMVVFMLYLETLSVRIKMGAPFRNTLIYKAFLLLVRRSPSKVRKRVKRLSTTAILIIGIVVVCVAGALVMAYFAYRYYIGGPESLQFEYYIIYWIGTRLIAIPLLILFIRNIGYVREAGRKIAKGELSSEDVSSQLSIRAVRQHGEDLDHIKRDMFRAAEQEMKDERFRNELISNLSHDIRTPLTSIKSYVELLENDDITEEQRREYTEVLDRQVERLSSLSKDLMDIAKFTTGNVKVNLENVDAGVLVEQITGEHYFALQSKGLDLRLKKEERPYTVMADGELLGRAITNLMTNIEKYALDSTRVFITVNEENGKVKIIFRNTCRDIPELTGEELVGRSVRGDRSRHTEGSGLGLSIAKSLTELQHGTFGVEVNDDIFTVTLTFDLVHGEPHIDVISY